MPETCVGECMSAGVQQVSGLASSYLKSDIYWSRGRAPRALPRAEAGGQEARVVHPGQEGKLNLRPM
jgi:hypothetical protein